MTDDTMVNLGCGPRYIDAPNWRNFDFSSPGPAVQQCNLLSGLPLSDSSVDFFYSSHFFEHITLYQNRKLLTEIIQKLKPGGRIRIVVPDLEDICINYLNSLALRRNNGSMVAHQWATIELLDQMVRQTPGGQMVIAFRDAAKSNNQELKDIIFERTGFDVTTMKPNTKPGIADKLSRLSFEKAKTLFLSNYVRLICSLIPGSLRDHVIDRTPIGEKHKWMYDKESLSGLLAECGFQQIEFHTAETSSSLEFLKINLDLGPDGGAYKHSSIYAEAVK